MTPPMQLFFCHVIPPMIPRTIPTNQLPQLETLLARSLLRLFCLTSKWHQSGEEYQHQCSSAAKSCLLYSTASSLASEGFRPEKEVLNRQCAFHTTQDLEIYRHKAVSVRTSSTVTDPRSRRRLRPKTRHRDTLALADRHP